MVIAITNSKGSVFTMACEGSDPELALDDFIRTSTNKEPRWLIHYERGFDNEIDAQRRVQSLSKEIGATSEHSQSAQVQ